MEAHEKEMVFLGEIINTHGIRGEVKVNPYLSLESFRLEGKAGFLGERKSAVLVDPKGEKKNVEIVTIRQHKDFLILKFADCDNVEKANAMKKWKVAIERLPLVEGSYYVRDLLGMDVFKEVENKLYNIGKIVDVLGTEANDIYVIKKGKKEIFFPALKTLVKEIDLLHKRMVVYFPKGL